LSPGGRFYGGFLSDVDAAFVALFEVELKIGLLAAPDGANENAEKNCV
jgi:hypothetical protein